MALISCPECRKEISDAARSCPHCGYELKKAPVTQVRCTPLSAGTYHISGIFWAAGGMIMCLGGFLFLPLGILPIIFGGAMIIFGIQQLGGVRKGTCPYCGNAVSLSVNDLTCKCPHYHKTSTRKDNFLETID